MLAVGIRPVRLEALGVQIADFDHAGGASCAMITPCTSSAIGLRSAFLVLALAAASTLLSTQTSAAEVAGRVVAISDGDTLTLLAEGRRQVRVRLAEIDAPESRQPYGSRSRQALSDLAFGQPVRVVVVDTDRYGRTVGRVYTGPRDVNAEMVRRGAAWVYRRYSRDPSLLRLEAEARAARRGLWALSEAQRTPPWEWRAMRRGARH